MSLMWQGFCYNRQIQNYKFKVDDVFLKLVPFGGNGQAGQEEGRCSVGEMHHSASGNVL